MTFEICPIRRDELGELLRLVRGLAEYEELSHMVVASEADYEVALFGSHPVAEALLARQHGRAVGFALYFENFSTFLGKRGLYLEDLFVEPTARRSGIGQALIREVARIALLRGCGRFEWSVLDWNQNAITFYEKMGATVLPEWRIVRTSGEAIMRMASRGKFVSQAD